MNNLSPNLLAQLFAQESNDPFLMLLTLSHPSFPAPIYLVNNSVNVTSRSNVYLAFPFTFKLPVDDGETAREVQIEFDNVGLDLVEWIRSVTDPIDVKMELILASIPDDVQVSLEELKIGNINYNQRRISARLYLDNFLNTELTSERYYPSNFPGLF